MSLQITQKRELQTRWINAVATMMGSMIGVGVFGLPLVFAKVGFFYGVLILVLVALMTIFFQLIFAEIATHTKGEKRIFELVRTYLGVGWSVCAIIFLFGLLWGAMTAHIILGGSFVQQLFSSTSDGPVILFSLLFALIASLMLLFDLHKLIKFERIIILLLLSLFFIIILAGIPHISFDRLNGFDGTQIFTVYGVVLFALGSFGIAPEMHAVLGQRFSKYLPTAMLTAYLIVAILYGLFSLVMVGVGAGDFANALDGVTLILGPSVGLLGLCIGLLAVFSIFLMVGIQIKDTLLYDLQMHRITAWVLTCAVPIGLYILGAREFIHVMGFVGAVFGSLTVAVILLTYLKMRKTVCRVQNCFALPSYLVWGLMALFLMGAVAYVL